MKSQLWLEWCETNGTACAATLHAGRMLSRWVVAGALSWTAPPRHKFTRLKLSASLGSQANSTSKLHTSRITRETAGTAGLRELLKGTQPFPQPDKMACLLGCLQSQLGRKDDHAAALPDAVPVDARCVLQQHRGSTQVHTSSSSRARWISPYTTQNPTETVRRAIPSEKAHTQVLGSRAPQHHNRHAYGQAHPGIALRTSSGRPQRNAVDT